MSLESAIEAQTEAIKASNAILQVLASHITGLMIGKAPAQLPPVAEAATHQSAEPQAQVAEVEEPKPQEAKATKTETKKEKATTTTTKPAPETPEEKISYDDLVKRVTPLLKLQEPGKKAFAALLEERGVNHAKKLEPEQYADFIAAVEAKIDELKAA